MRQVLFRIPNPWNAEGLPIYGFGVMLCLAFLLCTWMAARRAARYGLSRENVQDMVIWLFVGGILGARIIFLAVEQHARSLKEFLVNLPRIWDGGLVLYGSVLGGLAGYLGFWWFTIRKHKITTVQLADVLAPCIALGLCLGRFGCFLNGCCYGQVACPECAVYPKVQFPVSAPPGEALVGQGYQTAAGFTVAEPQPGDRGVRVGQVLHSSPAWEKGLRPGDVIVAVGDQKMQQPDALEYLDPRRWHGKSELRLTVEGKGELEAFTPHTLGLYPTQLYEVVSMSLLMLVLLAYEPFRRRPGQVMAVLMIGYAIHRSLNELLRDDPRPVGFERYVSVVLFAAGLGLWLYLQFRPGRSESGLPNAARNVSLSAAAASPSR
jgi:phosphatidylglycerol:prolipoprotein diacylglycerol transferase